jgi:hypothetical protein
VPRHRIPLFVVAVLAAESRREAAKFDLPPFRDDPIYRAIPPTTAGRLGTGDTSATLPGEPSVLATA